MAQRSTIFLQAVIVLIGIVALAILIRFPVTEGRAKNLDVFSIYLDPFILYGYATSVTFFMALFKAFNLLGYIRQNNVFLPNSVSALRSIKHCSIIFCILIVSAGLYIKLFHNPEDDPVGFLAICIITAFVSIVVAAATAVIEKIVQYGVDIKLEKEQPSAKSTSS